MKNNKSDPFTNPNFSPKKFFFRTYWRNDKKGLSGGGGMWDNKENKKDNPQQSPKFIPLLWQEPTTPRHTAHAAAMLPKIITRSHSASGTSAQSSQTAKKWYLELYPTIFSNPEHIFTAVDLS